MQKKITQPSPVQILRLNHWPKSLNGLVILIQKRYWNDQILRRCCPQSRSLNGKDETSTKDSETGWHVNNDRRDKNRTIYGIIHNQSVTPSNTHDSQERDILLKQHYHADTAYSPGKTQEALAKLTYWKPSSTKGMQRETSTGKSEFKIISWIK